LTEKLQNTSKFSIFPVNFTLTENTQSQSDTNKVAKITEENSLVICNNNLQLITTNEIVKPTIELSNNNAFDKNDSNLRCLFQQICNNEIHIKQPGPKWSFHKSLEPSVLVFSELDIVSPTNGAKKVPIYTKKVRFYFLFLS